MHRVVRVLPDTWGQRLFNTVLSGSSHSHQISCSHLPSCLIKSDECCIQVYKFLYASRLLDCGLASQAFHYCEVVGQAILRQREPFFVLTGELIKVCSFTHIPIKRTLYSVGVYRLSSRLMYCMYVHFLLQLSDRLRHSEGQFSEGGLSGTEQEPDWLKRLRARYHSLQVRASDRLLQGRRFRTMCHIDKK